jgi:RNA polymerase sigma factor (sigma-70 family)
MIQFNEKLLKQYTPLINATAHSYGIKDKDVLEDLRQEGRIGLWEATLKYDETKGAFPSFAKTHIRKHQLRFLDNNLTNIRIPVNIKDKELKANYRTISLDTPINDFNILLSDSIPNEDQEEQMDITPLKIAILKLKPKDQELINEYNLLSGEYKRGQPTLMLAAKYNITRQAIHQRINSIIKKIEKYVNDNQQLK